MIGYLICDPGTILDGFKPLDQWRLKTWKRVLDDEFNGCRLVLFQNENPNNYLIKKNDLIVLLVGTLIYEHKRGLGAAKAIADNLSAGVSIEKIYEKSFGSFTLLIADKKLSELALFTDREGMQAAYIYNRNGHRIISSNLLILAALSGVEVDSLGAGEYLHLGHCWHWRTIFNGIKKIQGGTQTWKGKGGWKTKRIWRINVSYPYIQDNDFQITKKVGSLIDESITEVAETLQKPIGLDLTGGSDSRTILSFCLKHPGKFEATTAGPKVHEDVIVADKIANSLNLPFYWFDDRQINNLNFEKVEEAIEIADGTLQVLTVIKALDYYKEKSKKYDIMMGGCGGPLFKDHYWLFEFNIIDRLREPNWDRYSDLIDKQTNDKLIIGFENGIRKHVKQILSDYTKSLCGPNNQKMDFVYFDLKCPNATGPQFGFTNQYLDIYHPLMDGRIVEYVINARPFIRKWNNLEFSLIYNNSKKLAWLRTDNGTPAVPSIGSKIYLRSFIAMRYSKAIYRRVMLFFMQKDAAKPVHAVGDLMDKIRESWFEDIFRFRSMRLNGVLERMAFEEILNGGGQAIYSNYLRSIFSVELALRHTEALRKSMLL